MNSKKLLFPHEKIRDIQDKLIIKIDEVVKTKKNLVAHAPTGLGKTAAAIGPCLRYAVDNNLTVMFLTSRHTQHLIALETLAQIKDKYKVNFNAISIIGKKLLCLQPGVNKLFSGDFAEYCKTLKADDACDFYSTLKDKEKLSKIAISVIKELKMRNPVTTEQIIETSRALGVCPYEIALAMAKDAKVIISDYNYIFNPNIREHFLKRINKTLQDLILIVDEGHNIPNRVKDMLTERLTNIMIKRAISEAKKFNHEGLQHIFLEMLEVLQKYAQTGDDEIYIKKEEFIAQISRIKEYDELVSDLTDIAETIREEQQQSYIGSIALFLENWKGEDEGYTRILSKKPGAREQIIMLSYRCLDPSLVTQEAIKNAHSTIMMSGTLTPTAMYRELLGFEQCEEVSYDSPFPEKNQLTMIIPRTSTKFTKRNEQQYKDIAEITAKICNAIPGNSAVFFPSYKLMNDISQFFSTKCIKTIFTEEMRMTKPEKEDFLERFKKYNKTGAVLCGVISGNFGEGIDLPGDYLKGVVIVGLPLLKPDLETKALINYFDKKFNKGWDYGYLFPAFNKVLQSAGRCIRSETDKGVIAFLDERYVWPNYYRCFPPSWSIKTTFLFEDIIKKFFEDHSK